MQRLRHLKFGGLGWRRVLAIVAMCSLTVSLATRFCVQTTQTHLTKSVERRSFEPRRQNLDRDATRWVAPSTSFVALEPNAVAAHFIPTSPLLPVHVFDDSLYNRPPPSFLA